MSGVGVKKHLVVNGETAGDGRISYWHRVGMGHHSPSILYLGQYGETTPSPLAAKVDSCLSAFPFYRQVNYSLFPIDIGFQTMVAAVVVVDFIIICSKHRLSLIMGGRKLRIRPLQI